MQPEWFMSVLWRSLRRRSPNVEIGARRRARVSLMRSTAPSVSAALRVLPTNAPTARAQRAWALAAALAVSGGFAVLAPGCTPQAAAPAIATGEKPTTGVPRYDRLFNDVHSCLVAVQEARSEEVDARGALARRLGLPETVPVDALGVRLRERTERLARDGLTLELEFTGIEDVDGLDSQGDAFHDERGDVDGAGAEGAAAMGGDGEGEPAPPTATLRTPGREPQPRELRLLEALAQAALSAATIYSNMGRERRRTERLLTELGELEGRVDNSFSEPSDRERVRRKLGEAKEFLPQLNAQAREVSGAADILISLLDEAANTAPVTAARRRPAPPRDAPRVPAAPTPASPPRANPAAPSASIGFPLAPSTPPASTPQAKAPSGAPAPAMTP